MRKKLQRIWNVLSHPRLLRMALSGFGAALCEENHLGALSDEERTALSSWVRSSGAGVFVEIGTLFGFTARFVNCNAHIRTVAVDNFSWNPFGLSPSRHEAFTRRILEGSSVELVRCDASKFLSSFPDVSPHEAFVFLDGSHAYEDVKRELQLCLDAGVAVLSGHDYGNESFGVTKAVNEILGKPDAVVSSCWMKKICP